MKGLVVLVTGHSDLNYGSRRKWKAHYTDACSWVPWTRSAGHCPCQSLTAIFVQIDPNSRQSADSRQTVAGKPLNWFLNTVFTCYCPYTVQIQPDGGQAADRGGGHLYTEQWQTHWRTDWRTYRRTFWWAPGSRYGRGLPRGKPKSVTVSLSCITAGVEAKGPVKHR